VTLAVLHKFKVTGSKANVTHNVTYQQLNAIRQQLIVWATAYCYS